MTLRKLGWIVGGFGLLSFVGAVVFLSLLLFTDVLDETEEQMMYDCTACLKKDPTKCKTIRQEWWMVDIDREEDARKEVAFRLCREVIPLQEDRTKHTCGEWVFERRDEVFEIHCTSRLERRKKPWNWPVH